MDIICEVSDTLTALLADRGVADPTFQRMVSVYRDVTDLLGRRHDYDQIVTGLLATTRGRQALGTGYSRLAACPC